MNSSTKPGHPRVRGASSSALVGEPPPGIQFLTQDLDKLLKGFTPFVSTHFRISMAVKVAEIQSSPSRGRSNLVQSIFVPSPVSAVASYDAPILYLSVVSASGSSHCKHPSASRHLCPS